MKVLASRSQAYLWLIVCAAAGLAMAFLFDDSCQQDGGQHYLFARWAWVHPELFVGVWARPLFTSIYAFPALIGYRAARLLTVLICLAIAHQTWRLAEDLKIDRAPFAIALVWLQPSFFLFCADNMTEPIFALVYVIALRLHHRRWIKAGMIVASLMILARPEGLFLGVLWGIWGLRIADCGHHNLPKEPTDRWLAAPNAKSAFRIPQSAIHNPQLLLLATGAFIWWLAALVIAGTVYGVRIWMASPEGRVQLDTLRLRVYGLGRIVRSLSIARFCRVLGTLLKNGVPLLQSLRIAKDASGNVVLAKAIENAADNITSGKSLAKPLGSSGEFPIEIVEMIAVGEEANNLENVLVDIADTLERRTNREVDMIVRLLEPMMLLVMAAVVLFVVIAILLPILQSSGIL